MDPSYRTNLMRTATLSAGGNVSVMDSSCQTNLMSANGNVSVLDSSCRTNLMRTWTLIGKWKCLRVGLVMPNEPYENGNPYRQMEMSPPPVAHLTLIQVSEKKM
ncbi:hypothetical protein AVEN_217229-1 [Araneus ventricosus]|uniref:Uncharacterized protein n=1 Tax=Araneus ventricosus TaxID=182803 RepID=A0A4Y2Q500_ARAVE|nr:hypothetical protein AVEN_217229-1 [Araneus ventricosus]